ncbi:MAG TPA: nitroreductase family protein, partial [Acidobacteriota bacterium]|nr:nitroreductase family protein [Acidobacteriota bacterium]
MKRGAPGKAKFQLLFPGRSIYLEGPRIEKDPTMTTPLDTLIRSRRSIRRFLPDPVDREKILSCLEAARLAPSAENAQPWRFLVVDDP